MLFATMIKHTKEEVARFADRLQQWLDEQDQKFYVTDISNPPSLTPAVLFDEVPSEYVEEFKRIRNFFPGEFTCIETLIRSPHHQCLLEQPQGTFRVIAELNRLMDRLEAERHQSVGLPKQDAPKLN